jgi:hypothetical protein
MADETTTNLVEGDDTSEPDTGTDQQEVETEGLEADQQFDEDGNPIDPEPDEDEEVELDEGLKVKVPKSAAAKLKELREGSLRQADYTRKTQELADQRKAVEVERETVQQATQAELTAHAEVVAIDRQLAEYQKVDWNAVWENDPLEAPRHWAAYQGLLQSRQHAAQQFGFLRQQRTEQTQQISAKRIQESAAALADPVKGIKGWSPDYAAKLLETGVREYGFERREIEEFEDHRMVRVLDDAAKWRAHLKSQKKAASVAKGQEVTPVQNVKGASGRAPVSASTKDFAAFEKLASK